MPISHVFAELDRSFRSGDYSGFNCAGELYRDDVHLNNVGKYVAGLTVFAAVAGDLPESMEVPTAYNRPIMNFRKIDTELSGYLRSADRMAM